MYTKFQQTDKEKSQVLAEKLAVSATDVATIEAFFDEMLVQHEKINDYQKETFAERIEQEIVFDQKSDELLENIQNSVSQVYLLAKSLSYYNIFQGGSLTKVQQIGIFGAVLQKIYDQIKQNQAVTPVQLVAISEFVNNPLEVSVNGELCERLFEILTKNKIDKSLKTTERQVFIRDIFSLINDLEFHHSIVIFKKALQLIKPEDTDLIALVNHFEVKNKQGCYVIINQLFSNSFSEDIWTDFTIKNELLQLFDTASGSEPKDAWFKKYDKMRSEIGLETLKNIANQVKSLEKFRKHDNYFEWTDEVAVRFLEAADFIIGME